MMNIKKKQRHLR